jgi:hypothetical protein
MIAVTTDDSVVVLKEDVEASNEVEILPRVNRTATLDGGAVLTVSGNSHADRTLTIKGKDVPPATELALRRISIQSRIVTLANKEGVFLGAISKFTSNNGDVSFTFLIKEKLTQD